MFHTTADQIWNQRLAAYPDRFSNADLAGEEVTLDTHIDIELSGGMLVGGYDCKVDMSNDGDDWAMTGVEYCSDLAGMNGADDFDVPTLRATPPDGTLRDLIRREVLQLLDAQYNSLADAATIKARRS